MMVTEYANECMFILGLEIVKCLMLEENHLYIDLYYEKIKKIYLDYLEYDNSSKSLLDSIHDYIEKREDYILDELKGVFDYV